MRWTLTPSASRTGAALRLGEDEGGSFWSWFIWELSCSSLISSCGQWTLSCVEIGDKMAPSVLPSVL